jgi:hypothetical protein
LLLQSPLRLTWSRWRYVREAELEIAGAGRAEMASQLNVTARTISRQRHTPEVRAMVEQLSRRPAAMRARDVLLEVMSDPNADVRLRVECARAVLALRLQREPEEQVGSGEDLPEPPQGYAVVALERPWESDEPS